MAKENQTQEVNANADAKVVNTQIITDLPTEVKTLSVSKISVAKKWCKCRFLLLFERI